MLRRVLWNLAMILLIAACGCRQQSALPPVQGTSAGTTAASFQDPACPEDPSSVEDPSAPEDRYPAGDPSAAEDPPSNVQNPPDSGAEDNQLEPVDPGDEPPDPDDGDGADDMDQEPRVRIYTTGDSDVWPSYDLPLVFKIGVPKVPARIMRPAPPIPED